jgi:hypothetical protein
MGSNPMRTLGAQCTPTYMYFALVEDGAVLDVAPQRADVPELAEPFANEVFA